MMSLALHDQNLLDEKNGYIGGGGGGGGGGVGVTLNQLCCYG